jgi:5-methylcytosine-specific restriction endonuclease McrA
MTDKRRKLTKDERKKIYDKCGGHCAYCGCVLAYKDMQVDHVVPLSRGGSDTMINMLPSCRSCNYTKDSLTLEGFREIISKWPDVLMRDSVTYRNAVRYGLVAPGPHKIVFYFEKEE